MTHQARFNSSPAWAASSAVRPAALSPLPSGAAGSNLTCGAISSEVCPVPRGEPVALPTSLSGVLVQERPDISFNGARDRAANSSMASLSRALTATSEKRSQAPQSSSSDISKFPAVSMAGSNQSSLGSALPIGRGRPNFKGRQ
jgi:hypothetical protein